jgi:tungstate transport system permease protein
VITEVPSVLAQAGAVSGFPSGWHTFVSGVREGASLVFGGNQTVIDATVRTLHLALVATIIAAAIGIPTGCLLGLGRFRGVRVLLTLASAVTRIPPVAVGAFVLLLVTQESPWGGGPLAALHWQDGAPSAYMAQTLIGVPIMVALTASAVQHVPAMLIEQARAFGAPGWKRGALAIREARRSVVAALFVVMGVTMTTIGALEVSGGSLGNGRQVGAGSVSEPDTLALGAFSAIKQAEQGVNFAQAGPQLHPTQSLAVAYTIVLLGLFILIAVSLTRLQRKRISWIPGQLS